MHDSSSQHLSFFTTVNPYQITHLHLHWNEINHSVKFLELQPNIFTYFCWNIDFSCMEVLKLRKHQKTLNLKHNFTASSWIELIIIRDMNLWIHIHLFYETILHIYLETTFYDSFFSFQTSFSIAFLHRTLLPFILRLLLCEDLTIWCMIFHSREKGTSKRLERDITLNSYKNLRFNFGKNVYLKWSGFINLSTWTECEQTEASKI